MALNDELYSRLVNLYLDLNDHEIHGLNAKIILLLSQKLSNLTEMEEIIERLESEKITKIKE